MTLQNPGAAVADGDGGYTQTWTNLDPATWWVSIMPATARDLERVAAGTVLTTATHIITGPYRSDVTHQTSIVFGSRTFSVTGLSNPEERGIELIVVAVEVVS